MTDKIEAILLDMFGTFAYMLGVPREEIRAYLAQCVDPIYRPLELPRHWRWLPAYNDTKNGFDRLRKKHRVFVLSNATVDVTEGFLDHNDLNVDGIVNLAAIRRYKPHPECYTFGCEVAGVEPNNALMVTANPTFGPYPFGDLEIAGAIGMQTQLIRNPGCPQTIIELAEQLGC